MYHICRRKDDARVRILNQNGRQSSHQQKLVIFKLISALAGAWQNSNDGDDDDDDDDDGDDG